MLCAHGPGVLWPLGPLRCVSVYTVRAIFSFILVCACIRVYFIYLIIAFNPGLVPALCIFVTPFPDSKSASSHYVWYIFAYYLISLCVTRLLTLQPTCWSPVPAASSEPSSRVDCTAPPASPQDLHSEHLTSYWQFFAVWVHITIIHIQRTPTLTRCDLRTWKTPL